jgi:hypothetical protein
MPKARCAVACLHPLLHVRADCSPARYALTPLSATRGLPCATQATLDVIEAVCSFGCAYLKTVPRHAPASMQALVQSLHDNLLRVEFESDVQDSMCRLCEAWYLGAPESRRTVVPQSILYLLLHSVGDKSKLGDVKRVSAMREALLCIELGGSSFQSVQESIMRAVIHPNYVMHDEGRRFLGIYSQKSSI